MPWIPSIVIACWLTFLTVWGIGAFNVKRDVAHAGIWSNRPSAWIVRAVLAIILVWLIVHKFFRLDSALVHHPLFDLATSGNGTLFASEPLLQILGAILCIGGIGLAIWARIYLGRNWSSHPALKAGHELVVQGPYAYIRHPIYTGLLIAVLGSALTSSPLWLLSFVAVLVLFLWRIPVEEAFMLREFPDLYPAYQKRTKALIPFVW